MKKHKFFDSTIKLFESYRNRMKEEKAEGYNSNLANEMYMRLKQLSFIYDKVRFYDRKILSPYENIPIEEIRKIPVKETLKGKRFLDEGIIFVETFYFFAWRVVCISKLLPHLKSLKKKAKSITIVRNCLIQHPETTEEKICMYSYGWGNDDRGPVLKNARPTEQSFEIGDEGFWKNAKEFKENLENLIENALVA